MASKKTSWKGRRRRGEGRDNYGNYYLLITSVYPHDLQVRKRNFNNFDADLFFFLLP